MGTILKKKCYLYFKKDETAVQLKFAADVVATVISGATVMEKLKRH
jgi:hypothetical protein